MLLFAFWFLVAFGTSGASAASVGGEPFWRVKERVYTRIQNGEVIVSVSSTTESSRPHHRLVISGGGQVRAPCSFVFQSVKDYEAVARATGYVDKASYAPETGILDARLSAYGLTSDIAFRLSSADQVLKYNVIKGPMKGMRGDFTFDGPKTEVCDVGLNGEFTYEKLPIPEFFLRFGLEVMLQRMAISMRRYTEKKFKGGGA